MIQKSVNSALNIIINIKALEKLSTSNFSPVDFGKTSLIIPCLDFIHSAYTTRNMRLSCTSALHSYFQSIVTSLVFLSVANAAIEAYNKGLETNSTSLMVLGGIAMVGAVYLSRYIDNLMTKNYTGTPVSDNDNINQFNSKNIIASLLNTIHLFDYRDNVYNSSYNDNLSKIFNYSFLMSAGYFLCNSFTNKNLKCNLKSVPYDIFQGLINFSTSSILFDAGYRAVNQDSIPLKSLGLISYFGAVCIPSISHSIRKVIENFTADIKAPTKNFAETLQRSSITSGITN